MGVGGRLKEAEGKSGQKLLRLDSLDVRGAERPVWSECSDEEGQITQGLRCHGKNLDFILF